MFGAGSDPRNLIINYIPTPVSEEELKQLFVQYGEVESARIILDRETGQPKGYGFVKFMNEDSAHEAIRKMNGFEIHNKRLKVTTARGPAAMHRGNGGGSSHNNNGNNNNGGSSHHSNNNQYQNNNNNNQQHGGGNNNNQNNGGGSHGNNNNNTFGVQQGNNNNGQQQQHQGMMMMGGDGSQPMMMYQPMPASFLNGGAQGYMGGYPMMQPVMMMPQQMGMAPGNGQYGGMPDAAALQQAYLQGLQAGAQQGRPSNNSSGSRTS